MKILVFTSFLVILCQCNPAAAQVLIGPKGGLNYTGFSGDNPRNSSYASDVGYDFGVTGDVHITEDIVLILQPELSHQATIVQFDVDYQYEKFDSLTISVDYFDMPLRLKIITDNQMSYVTAGLVFSVPLNAEAKNNRNGDIISLKNNFQSYAWEASFGVGFRFHIGKPLMFVELNYVQGLTNLTKGDNEDQQAVNDLKSKSFQLTTGILFTL
jgi:hypothetical protein